MDCAVSVARPILADYPVASTHIIIVNYNAGEWLGRAVASALTYSNGNVTVVDNASTDNSVASTRLKCGEPSRLHWIENPDNRGFAAANNQVLSGLQEDYAVMLNPDAEIVPESLPLILAEFERHADMGLASCRILNADGSLQATCRRRFPTPWSAFVRMLRLDRLFPSNPKFADFDYGDIAIKQQALEFVEAISGAFMVVRKSALAEVGLLDEAYFMHCEDLDWCKRFALAGWKVGFVSTASVLHAKGVSSASRPIGVLWTLHRGMNRFFDKHYRKQYSWLLRWLVKFGIAMSFISRSLVALIRVGIDRSRAIFVRTTPK